MVRLLPFVSAFAALFVFGNDVTFSHIQDSKWMYFQSPPGYEDFCVLNSELCSDGITQTIKYSDDLIKTLTEVNNNVNKFPYVFDTTSHYMKDYWSVIDKEGGDCEDYAIRKKKELIKLGISGEALKFRYLSTYKMGKIHNHVVLAVKTDRGDLILDNFSSDVKFANTIKDYSWLLEEDTTAHWRNLQ